MRVRVLESVHVHVRQNENNNNNKICCRHCNYMILSIGNLCYDRIKIKAQNKNKKKNRAGAREKKIQHTSSKQIMNALHGNTNQQIFVYSVRKYG